MKRWIIGLVMGAVVGCTGQVYASIVTYGFTGTVTYNGGITAVPVGSAATGTITYDSESVNILPGETTIARYQSPLNHLVIVIGGNVFSTAGDGFVDVGNSVFSSAETFGPWAGNMNLPSGWSIDHSSVNNSMGVFLQNAPRRGVLSDLSLPSTLHLEDWVDTHTFHLYFGDGVTFPGGSVTTGSVQGTIDTLAYISPVPEPTTLIIWSLLGAIAITVGRWRRRQMS